MNENVEIWWIIMPILAGLAWIFTIVLVSCGVIKRKNLSVIATTNEIAKFYFLMGCLAVIIALVILSPIQIVYIIVFSFLQNQGIISKDVNSENDYFLWFGPLIHFIAQCKAYHLAIRNFL